MKMAGGGGESFLYLENTEELILGIQAVGRGHLMQSKKLPSSTGLRENPRVTFIEYHHPIEYQQHVHQH